METGVEIDVLCVFLWLLWPVSCGSYGSFLWFLWWWFLVVTGAVAVMFGGARCRFWLGLKSGWWILARVEIKVVGFGWG